ncbi:MAG: hypothetical protein LBU05_04550 [Bifidobacteriaceae bacterium]|jgi:hypothetical protein|nr:hypothetical protein [Bifidobacteriaceae bacterium]
MLKTGWLFVVAPAAALLTGLTACSATPQPRRAAALTAADQAALSAALSSLGSLAAACAAAPPSEFTSAGLELLARHAPVWQSELAALTQLGLDGLSPVAADSPACDSDGLRRDLGRVRTLSLRLTEAESGDQIGTETAPPSGVEAVAGAVARAAAADEAILFDSLAGAAPPAVEDLATLGSAQLADLALAEDQAGFVGEFLAARVNQAWAESEELRAALSTAAALHRVRGQALASMAGDGHDSRQGAYRLEEAPTDADAARARWAAAELALASHYAALPGPNATDQMLTWQLVEAAAWGADIPALPFLA